MGGWRKLSLKKRRTKMKKIRNFKKTKKKKENYYENNNLKKRNQPHKIENRAFTMYWRKFSSESLLPPHTPAPQNWLKLNWLKPILTSLNQAESSIKPNRQTTTETFIVQSLPQLQERRL